MNIWIKFFQTPAVIFHTINVSPVNFICRPASILIKSYHIREDDFSVLFRHTLVRWLFLRIFMKKKKKKKMKKKKETVSGGKKLNKKKKEQIITSNLFSWDNFHSFSYYTFW